MALTNIQIFKMTPKANCKECGSSTCMGFAMKVYQGNVDISACPYISEEDPTTSTDADKLRANDIRYILGGKIFCPNCKNKIEENMNFCPFCGEKIPEKEDKVEVRSVYDITKTNGAFQEERPKSIDLHTQNEDMVCPNCGNDIEEDMVICPFCDEEISRQKEDIKKICISDITESNETFQGEGAELIGLYTQDEINVTVQEESVEEPTPSNDVFQEKSPEPINFYAQNENVVCPNCGNDIEEGMIICPFCDEKIPEIEMRTEEVYVSDINEVDGAIVNNPILSDSTGVSADIQEEILMAGSVPVSNRSEDAENKEILKKRKITKMDEKEKDWIDKKWEKKTLIEKSLTVSVYIFWIAVIWFVWKSWSTSYTYIVDHLMYENSVEYINTLLEDYYCKNIDIPRYRKKYIYHSGRGENTSKYNDIPNKYSNNFYEYCTVTLPVEYREVNGKEVSEEMMIEFHVFKPSNYESMEPEDIHIINLTKKKFDELKENLNELETGDLNWDY